MNTYRVYRFGKLLAEMVADSMDQIISKLRASRTNYDRIERV